MITEAAVKIFDKKQGKELILPCHRHWNVFYILKQVGYTPNDYDIIEQGFFNEKGEFLNRIAAKIEAKRCNQLLPHTLPHLELFSEDLW